MLFRIHHTHAVLAQLHLVDGDLFAVSAEAVNLPHDNSVKQSPCTILQHTLKVSAVIVAAGLFVVGILAYNCDIVLLGKLGALADLPFDAFVCLVGARRIPGVDDCFHVSFAPPLKRNINFDALVKLVLFIVGRLINTR